MPLDRPIVQRGKVRSGGRSNETAYNLAKAAFSNKLPGGRDAPTYSAQQIYDAKQLLPKIMGTGEFENPMHAEQAAAGKVENQARMAEAIKKAESQDMKLNGMAVKLNAGGSLVYDLERIGADLGMSPEAIEGANIGLGSKRITPGQRLDDLSENQAYVGGVGDNESERKAQFDKAIASLNDDQAILNNLSQISVLDDIDFTKEDVLANLAKPGFAWDVQGSMKDQLNKNQGPTGAGAWARYAVPALAALVMGPAIASQFGAFGAGSTLLGGGTSAMPAGGAGLNALNPAVFSAGSGAGVGAGAGGAAINAIQSGALAAGAGGGANALAAGATTAAGSAAAAGGVSAVASIPWDTIISVGGNLAGGVLSYVGAGNAADAGSDAADKSADAAWQMYQQGREDLAPWREAGGQAVQDLAGKVAAGPGEFEESPGYQFTLNEGLNAQQNALSAMGSNRSGKHIKAATDYAEGLASTEYDNFLNRWYKSLTPHQSLAGVGQTSAGQTANLGAGAASNAGNAYMAGGQSQGAGYINQTNALTGAIQGGANALLQSNSLRNLPGSTGGYGGGYGGDPYAPGRP